MIAPSLKPAVTYNLIKSVDRRHGNSYQNKVEALAMTRYIEFILMKKYNISANEIGCIVPYSAQRDLLNEIIQSKIQNGSPTTLADVKISSVDGFQGSEMEAIVLGMVRSNKRCVTGFTKDLKRFNVATTRAKKHLACFAN